MLLMLNLIYIFRLTQATVCKLFYRKLVGPVCLRYYVNVLCLDSCNIERFYTSIPIELGLEKIGYWIMRKRNLIQ